MAIRAIQKQDRDRKFRREFVEFYDLLAPLMNVLERGDRAQRWAVGRAIEKAEAELRPGRVLAMKAQVIGGGPGETVPRPISERSERSL